MSEEGTNGTLQDKVERVAPRVGGHNMRGAGQEYRACSMSTLTGADADCNG